MLEGFERTDLMHVRMALLDRARASVWKAHASGRAGARGTISLDADSGERCGSEERNARRAQRAAP